MSSKLNQGEQTTSTPADSADDIDSAKVAFDSIVKIFFRGTNRNWVLKATSVPGGVLALLNPKYGRGRLDRHFKLVFLPQGCGFQVDPIVVIKHVSIPAKFDPRLSMIFADFDRLATGHEKAYLPFARQVLSTLGRCADQLIDAIRVPGGFLVAFSSCAVHPEGLWLYTAQPLPADASIRQASGLNPSMGSVATRIKIETSAPTSWQSLYDEALLRQLTEKNGCMHTPSYRFEPCMLERAIMNGDLNQTCALVAQSTDINYINVKGKTALHEATLQKTAGLPVFRALLEAGADTRCRDADGCAPMQLAIKNCNATALIRLLEAEDGVPGVFGSYPKAIRYCEKWDAAECEHIIRAHHARVEALGAIQNIRNELDL